MYEEDFSVFKVIGYIVAGVIVLGIVFVLAWVLFLGNIFGPKNVSEQWRFAYEYNQALGAIALNVCSAEDAVASASDARTKTSREQQLIAYVNLYHTREAEYDARLRNNFQAGLVAPSDVPRRAPTLEEEKASVCPKSSTRP